MGRCTDDCPVPAAGLFRPGIRGRDISGARAVTSAAILLRNASGTVIEANQICGAAGETSAGIRVEGAADGVVVRGSVVAVWGGRRGGWAIDLADCRGHQPWIVDNHEIHCDVAVDTPHGAIRSVGDCHPVIENNRSIAGGLEARGPAHGILCGPSSRCVIEDNPDIRGSGPVTPTWANTGYGVFCEADGCARIVGNQITGGRSDDAVGLHLEGTDALVDRNEIIGGCATRSATAVQAIDSRARLQNDVIVGYLCNAFDPSLPIGSGPLRIVGVAVSGSDPSAQLDVRSCDIDPRDPPAPAYLASCDSAGIEIRGTRDVPIGLFRGNIVLAGRCNTAWPIREFDADSDPIALESNDLWSDGRPRLYFDEGMVELPDARAINSLTDARVADNLDADPRFRSYPRDLRLLPGSACIGRDRAGGAPAWDFEGNPRDAMPDIGAYEYLPSP
jgi:hypothetical protein